LGRTCLDLAGETFSDLRREAKRTPPRARKAIRPWITGTLRGTISAGVIRNAKGAHIRPPTITSIASFAARTGVSLLKGTLRQAVVVFSVL